MTLSFGRRLFEVIQEKLNQYGITAEPKRTSDKRIVKIIYKPDNSDCVSRADTTSIPSVQKQPTFNIQPATTTNKKITYTIPTPPTPPEGYLTNQ